MTRCWLTLALLLGLTVPVTAQINGGSPVYTFTPNTVISSTEVNANFAALFSDALNRTGGTLTGALSGTTGTFSGLFTVGSLTANGSGSFDGSVTVTNQLTVGGDATITGGLSAGAVSSTEFAYLDGASSNLQGQLNTLNTAFNNLPTTGRILQVVTAATTAAYGNATTSYTDTGLTATITPTKAGNILIVLVDQSVACSITTIGGAGNCTFQLLEGSTARAVLSFNTTPGITDPADDPDDFGFHWSPIWTTTAAGTTAVTYKTQGVAPNTSVTARTQIGGSSTARIIIVEIGQ